MINPSQITNFSRTGHQLEELLLFSISCAGKNSDVQAEKLDRFLAGGLPFATVRNYHKAGVLVDTLKRVGLGKYKLLSEGFLQAATDKILNLRKVNWPKLTQFTGVGLKTAKFFLCHSREDFTGAVLDTHVLNWLRGKYPSARIPKVSPTNPIKYREVEAFFLAECFKIGATPAELDLHIWKEMRNKQQQQ